MAGMGALGFYFSESDACHSLKKYISFHLIKNYPTIIIKRSHRNFIEDLANEAGSKITLSSVAAMNRSVESA